MHGHEITALPLFVDGLALAYHEARHVRFLIQNGHVHAMGWERLVSLPKNRIDAWKQLQPIRQAARSESNASSAAHVFEARFGRSLNDLAELYENSHWKHASSVGGHAWRGVTVCVRALGESLHRQDGAAVARGSSDLRRARHNNGLIRDKLAELDRATGQETDARWHDENAGA